MIGWEREENGWYVSELGGVVKEHDGWWFYRIGGTEDAGPFGTMKAARRYAETPLSSTHRGPSGAPDASTPAQRPPE